MKKVTVRAPARLHLGFLDLNGQQGRKFGSIGLAVDSHYMQVSVAPSQQLEIVNPNSPHDYQVRVKKVCEQFYQTIGQAISDSDKLVRIELEHTIPQHSGLGSGTQLSLSIAMALACYHKLEITPVALAQNLNRGKRSGVGISTFESGGFVVDGGLKPQQTVPPMLVRYDYPDEWRIILVMDPSHQGIHGQQETTAFQELPEFPLTGSQGICHLTMMQLLPALVERDIDSFGGAITAIQALVGDHFAPAQGGRYASDKVAECLFYAEQLGHKGIAQSSWGPTGCIFVESEEAAQQLDRQLQQHYATQPEQQRPVWLITKADNHGASIETIE